MLAASALSPNWVRFFLSRAETQAEAALAGFPTPTAPPPYDASASIRAFMNATRYSALIGRAKA
jgi:hypothetical protein